ncbi:TonB-dependent receptor [Ideonella sp. 4Y11]|uniref:TonB-dependent receptor n=1 Tax=Ideonella aquatica TaxID=2824119 RepID=A0A940YJ86_9BURK|nr:TonB-dependent receptor [Ideonella aquatica]MBQ0961085.1 TonB-dependent receptor [Ideonella aquatica]
MTRPTERSHPSRQRRHWQLTPLAVASTLALGGMGAAQAQESTQSVVVTGIRHAIETSIAIKRNSDSIVEAITAEDLGKLPDVSIAESLARLPGVTAQRVNGSTQKISVRGMPDKYTVTLLNGREVVNGGESREVELDQFPAELINGAVVYKTPDATLSMQGLAGTINMQTVRPLDLANRQITINLRGEKNSNGEQIPGLSATGNRLSASYVDQFADRTIGLALGYAHLDSPEQQQHYANWWWANTANTSSYPPDWCGGDCSIKGLAKDAVALQGFEATAFSTNQVRDGVMAVLEFKPNKDLHTVADLYYSTYDKKYVGREFQAEMTTWGGAEYVNPGYSNWDGEKVVTSGGIKNVSAKLLSRSNQRNDTIAAIGLNNEYKIAGWTTVADLSYSKAKREESTSEMYAGIGSLNNGFSSFSINRNGFSQFTPSVDWSDPAIIKMQQFWGQMGATRFFDVNDEAKAIKLGGRRDVAWGPVTRFEGGLNYAERSKDYKATKVAYDMKNGSTIADFPAGILMSPATLGFGSIPAVANFDVQQLLATGLFSSRPDDLSSAPNRQWGVAEKITTGYAKFDLDFTVGGLEVRGNAGLQVVHADQTGTGLRWDATTNSAAPISGGTSYTDVLPSLNLSTSVGEGNVIRFGLARQMARPNMEDMRAGIRDVARAQTGPGLWSAKGGNPKLEPWRADAVDLSFEKYFDKRSYAAVAAFYKDVKSSVYNQDIPYDFTGFPDPCVPSGSTTCTPVNTYLGTVNAPANGKGGYVRGSEFTLALDAGRLAPMLDGFGTILSASFTQSNIHQGNNLSNPLEGLSGTATSMVFYYEKAGFQARVGQRYRSRYLAAVRNAWGDTSYTTIEPERITDLQLGYGWDSGWLKGLSVLLQVNNLTNEPYRTKMGVDSNSGKVANLLYPAIYEKYGRQYLLGLSYKL